MDSVHGLYAIFGIYTCCVLLFMSLCNCTTNCQMGVQVLLCITVAWRAMLPLCLLLLCSSDIATKEIKYIFFTNIAADYHFTNLKTTTK